MNWKEILTRDLNATVDSIEKREAELDTCNGTVADESDAATLIETRAIIQSDLKRLAQKKERLQLGLQRIADGDFGFCEECGVDIPKKRLELNPGCFFCVECQSEAELKKRQYSPNAA